ncbi:MAG TPA: adenylate/guanylate cyclase domain-containing protein [Opitutales bacterium]|jgi:adenylate cyclase|nr:adenylate/guanylate cyclase domain-containing protein [Opitutales bacterium]
MAAPRQFSLRLVLLLALVPLAWLVMDHFKVFGRFNNLAEERMYQFRGEIPATDNTKPGHPSLKIIYVDVDSLTVGFLGERPWSREYYARVINALFQYGGAKAVGLDFILSPAGMKADMVDKDKAHKNDEVMGQVMEKWPAAIISTDYSDIEQPNTASTTASDSPDKATAPADSQAPSGNSSPPADTSAATDKTPAAHQVHKYAEFPYIYQSPIHLDPTKNDYPESPTFPLINDERIQTGMLDVATTYNGDGVADAVPRWVPLFAETTGPQHTDNIVGGYMDFYKINPEERADTDDTVMVVNPDSGDLFKLPKIQHVTFYHLAIKLALAYLGLDEKNVKRTKDDLQIVDNSGQTLIDIPLREQQLVEINWFSKWMNDKLNPRVSFEEVIARGADLETGPPANQAREKKFFEQFKDAIILIGPVDPILHDLAPTPFDDHTVPLVGVYGNLLKTFFTGEYINRPPGWVSPLLQILLTVVVAGLAVYSGQHAGLAKAAAVIVLLAYILGVFEIFAHFRLFLPLVVPVSSAFSTAFVGAVVRLVDEEKQKKRIKGMFATYLAPEVVNDMVSSGEEPQLGGHNSVITCFFSDVQGFSGFSEVLTPAKLVDLMNEYLTAMTDILQAERGSLDKYIGDAIVAMYGAPITLKEHALRACIAACRMQQRLGELRQKWISEGDKWPVIVHRMRMRIGLNSGDATVGNMGSATRFNYTMMGDTVNLAARCESGAKHFGVYSMCTEDTKKHAEEQGNDILFRRLNKIKVKGRSTPVEVYEIVGFRNEATPDTQRCVELFENALALYFTQKWDEAKALFAEAEKLEPFQPGRDPGVANNPSQLMQEMCDEMKASPPPADWDGVEEMTEK